jgi:hypothetical protein
MGIKRTRLMPDKQKNITSHIVILTSIFILNSLNAMENTCVWDTKSYEAGCSPNSLAVLHNVEHQQFFLCANILEGDGCEIITQQLKHKLCRIHSNSPSGLPHPNQHKGSIIFNDDKYDYVTLFDTALTSKPMLLASLARYRSYLTEQGKLLTMIQTQENEFCPEIGTFKKLYAKFYKSASLEYKQNIRKELLPSCVDFKNAFYTEQELRTEISKIGYHISSYQRKKYNIIIKNKFLYRIYLAETVFPQFAELFNLPKKAASLLKKEFVRVTMDTLQQDKDGNLIHPLEMTEILLSKYNPFEIKIRKKNEQGEWKEI